MDAPLVNRIAQSGIITFNLEDYYPEGTISAIDLKDYLFHGLILKEKDFRKALKELDWSQYQDHIVCIHCSADAIIPVWAYMLVAAHASKTASDIYQGTKDEYLKHHYYQVLEKIDLAEFDSARVVIKGCSNKPVPAAAYAHLTQLLRPVVKSVMYGEPCSTVPIYKRPLDRVR